MTTPLRLRFFAHSWRSDWNHGNAHFLRGLADELRKLGHEVRCYEPEDAWSYVNLLKEPVGKQSLDDFRAAFPDLNLIRYSPEHFGTLVDSELRDADVVVIHEWNSPKIVSALLAAKVRYGFRALFHDTHHRAYTSRKKSHSLISATSMASSHSAKPSGKSISRFLARSVPGHFTRLPIPPVSILIQKARSLKSTGSETGEMTNAPANSRNFLSSLSPPCGLSKPPCMAYAIHNQRNINSSRQALSIADTFPIFQRPAFMPVRLSPSTFRGAAMPTA